MNYIGEWIYKRKPRKKEFSTGEGWDSFARQDWQFVSEENKLLIGEMIAERVGDNKKVLDLASGSWHYIPTHTAVDSSREMLYRNPAINRLLFNLDWLAEGHSLPLPDKFDAVLFCLGYNYVRNPLVVFRESKRLLLPDGKIIVAGGVSSGCDKFELRRFKPEVIKAELESLGLEVVIHNVVDTLGLPREFSVVEAAEHLPEKQFLVAENVERVKTSLNIAGKRLKENYQQIRAERQRAGVGWLTQREVQGLKELEPIREVGQQLEERFKVRVFIVPYSPLKRDFNPKDTQSFSVGLILVGDGFMKPTGEFWKEIKREADMLLVEIVEIYNETSGGLYVIEDEKSMIDHINQSFQRRGKVSQVFFMAPWAFLHPAIYGDLQNFWESIFEKCSVPKRIIERDIRRTLMNQQVDESTIWDIRGFSEHLRRLALIVEEKGYL